MAGAHAKRVERKRVGVARHGIGVFSPPTTLQTHDSYSLEALEFSAVREGLARLCATEMGRAAARALIPGATGAESTELLARLSEATKLARAGRAPSLAGIEDLRPFVKHLSDGGRPLEPAAFAKIAASIRRAEDVRNSILQNAASAPKLASVASAIPDLIELGETMDRCVDARGEVLDTASEKLAIATARKRSIEHEVEQVMASVLARPDVRKSLNSPKVIYRNERPVVAVKAEYRNRVPGLLLDRSATGGSVFIEPREVVELGNELVEVGAVIAREISGILLELSRQVLARKDRLLLFTDLCAELDLEFTKAIYLEIIDGCVPEITKERRLKLSGARHPKLLEPLFEEYLKTRKVPPGRAGAVPIDVELGGEYDLLVITGPNTGGKTVALKTVGLLSAMALSGLPVPARAAEIPPFDGIFVDVGDEQEISQSLSTFSSHMVRVARAVHGATRESLVLLDEVGAGTDPAEGAVLGEAILEHFLTKGVRCIATTHLGRLKELAYRNPKVENGTVEFDPKTLAPRYRLIVGLPGASQALVVARRVGMLESIVDAAEARLERRDARTEDAVTAIQNARIEADAARRRADEILMFAESKQSAAEARERELDGRAALLAAEAQRVVDEAIGKLRVLLKDRLERIIANAPRPVEQRLRELREEVDGAIASEPIEQRRLAFVEKLKRDDIVYVPKLKSRCPVRKVHRDRKVVTVMVGDVPTEVRFDEVTWYEVL